MLFNDERTVWALGGAQGGQTLSSLQGSTLSQREGLELAVGGALPMLPFSNIRLCSEGQTKLSHAQQCLKADVLCNPKHKKSVLEAGMFILY